MNDKKMIKSCLAVAGLAVLMGLNYEVFIFPNAFAPAGINGLATMVQYLFDLSVGYFSLMINIPLILLAWKKVGREFALKNLVFVVVFSLSTLVLGRLELGLAYDEGNSAILGPLAAGVVTGAIYGLVIRLGGATGGTDIVAAWVRTLRPEASLVWVIFLLNASVAGLSFFVYGYKFEPVILCLLYCYISSNLSDRMLKGGKRALKFEVVTEQAEELSAQLLRELHHGVTVLHAQGMYSERPKDLLVCVVNRHQIVQFQEILSRYPGSFAYVSDVSETIGNFQHVAR